MREAIILFIASVSLILVSEARADAYLKAFGGLAVLNDFGAEGEHVAFNADPETGVVYGAAIGSTVSNVPGLTVELEAAFRTAPLDGTLTVCKDEGPLTGDSATFAALLNLTYGPPLGDFRPYALAGVGYGSRRVVLEPTPDNWTTTSTGAEEQGLAYQFGAGFEVEALKGVTFGLEYVYFVGPHNDRTVIWGGKSTFYESDGDSHETRATLKVAL